MIKSLGLAAVLLLVAACGDDPAAPPAGSGSAPKSASAPVKSAQSSTKPVASTAASAAPASDERGKMSHCPSAAEGAKTEIKDVDKGVEITIKAADADKTKDIRDRAKTIAERAKGEAGKPQHSGQGGGGGAMGRCPVVIGDTELKVEEIDGGAKLTVTAKDDKEVDWLRRESKERLASLEAGTADEAADRKMGNCPSAVAKSKTAVKEGADAIVVTITANDVKDEMTVKDIRGRSTKLNEVKHEGDGTKHDQKGAGGAKSGRCPVVIEGADATMKEIDGGVEYTLKPKNKADLKKVSTEVQERAKPFSG